MGAVACVLFTDLVGSTELMARLGDAAYDAVRSEHFQSLRAALTAAGGEEVKTTGDGLLMTFPSAVDALAGAVAAQQATERAARRGEVALSIRVGLALGEVTWEDGDVFGTPVVEAARLVAAARSGHILCTALVRAVAGSGAGERVSDAGALELKGLPEPVEVCEVAWQPLDDEAGPLPLPPLLAGPGRIFVGRDAPLERARRVWKEVAGDGGRRLVLLAGEPGIGKTRLAIELARAVHAEGAVVLAGRCDEDLGVPYQPFVEALRHYAGHAGGELRLGRHGGELARLVPELRDAVPDLAEPLRSDPETERYRLFDAVAAWLGDVSVQTPALLVLDDLHWAAKPTILLLRHVLRSPEPARLLVAVTYRDTDIGRGDPLTGFLADLRREEGVERLALGGLDPAGVGAFIEAAAGHSLVDEDGERFIRAVWAETEGNPFFVAEVVRHLTESGAIAQQDGRWTTTAPIDELGIPEGVRDVVGRRLSRLPEGSDRILAVGAVVGVEFEPAVVVAAGGFGEDKVFAALEAAVAARLLIEVPGAVPRNRFAHALVRATLYDEISAPRRAALHRRVAEAIEGLHGADVDDHLSGLAHHWARAPGGDPNRAVEYATRAGDRALAQLAHDEAATYYTQATELLDAAGVAPDDARRQELRISLGEAQKRAGNREYRKTLLGAAELAQQRRDPGALVRAALASSYGYLFTAWNPDAEKIAVLEGALDVSGTGDSPERAQLLATLALELVFDAEASERRRRMSDESLAMARRLGEPTTIARVLIARYLTTMPNPLAGRLADSVELVEAAQSVPDAVLRSHAWAMRFRVLLEAGDIAEADQCLDRAARLVEELGQPALLWSLTYLRTARAIVGARFEEAEDLIRSAEELGRSTGHEDIPIPALQRFLVQLVRGTLGPEMEEALAGVLRHGVALHRVWQLVLHCELGRSNDVRAALATLVPRDLPHDLNWISLMCSLATVASSVADVPLAEEVRTLLLPYTDHALSLAVIPMPAVVHHLALLATTIGSYDEAEEWFGAAAETHERLRAPAWLARTRLEWAAMLLRRRGDGDTERAGELLDQALATAVELGLPGIERRAHALLEDAWG